MTQMKNYLPLALVAVLAGIIGWSVSALGVNRSSQAVAPQVQTAPVTNQLVPVPAQSEQLVSQPLPSTAPEVVTTPTSIKAPATVKRSVARKRPVLRQPAVEGSSESGGYSETADRSSSRLPVRQRETGMSNGTKTAIAIGGGAATGAIIGAIAGGG